MELRPITTEKAVKMIDSENTLVFETGRNERKENIKKEIETLLDVKVKGLRTHVVKNKKRVYVQLAKTHVAADLATKLGVI